MTTISAKIIADSTSEQGIRLTTMELRYPRCIHAEFMTHRQFSRNAASSRAIPVAKMIESIKADPFVPIYWGKNQTGMQAREECVASVASYQEFEQSREEAWLSTMHFAINRATAFDQAGYHKQIVNRLLEPFMHITVVVTATEWSNFFALRDHPDAEPHIALLAKQMRQAMAASVPTLLRPGEWHLPYVKNDDLAEIRTWSAQWGETYDYPMKVSAARCARTSYLLHNGERPTSRDDVGLFERLAGAQPIHASPLEHQATPDWPYTGGEAGSRWQTPHEHGNLRGWRQFRKMLPGECQ